MPEGYEWPTHSDAHHAAELFLDLRRTGATIPELPDGLRPGPLSEAYAIQDALHTEAGWDIGVLKVGCTSDTAQAALGIGEPIAGRVPAMGVHRSPATVALTDFHHPPLVECEFGLRFGRSTGADTTIDATEIAASIDAVVPAIELVDSRFDVQLGASGASLVADNAVSAAVVLGAPSPVDDLSELTRAGVSLWIDDERVAEGTGAAALGAPVRAAEWMVQHEQRRGRSVEAGTVVITGTCTGLVACVADAVMTADFGPLGSVTVTLTSAGSS